MDAFFYEAFEEEEVALRSMLGNRFSYELTGETIQEAGLNPYLFEMANIRDQCSWAHMNEPDLATRKSSDLVKMAVAKARDLSALGRLPIQITPEALVIGGGLAGMASSLSLAEAGYQVFLVERENTLGGNLRNLDVYDINPDEIGRFDVVLLLGVLYHLKHPVLALERISEITKDQLIIETEWLRSPLIKRPILEYIESDSVNQDPTNWCRPNILWIKSVLRDVGFAKIEVLYKTPLLKKSPSSKTK